MGAREGGGEDARAVVAVYHIHRPMMEHDSEEGLPLVSDNTLVHVLRVLHR